MSANPNKLSKFWQEFRRRKVLPFLIGYIAACFAIIEFLTNTSERYSIPDTTVDLIYILAAIGLPIVIVLPWFINRKNPEAINDELDAKEPSSKSDIPATPENSILVLPFPLIQSFVHQTSDCHFSRTSSFWRTVVNAFHLLANS